MTFTLPGSRWTELARAGQAEFRMLGVLPQARGRGVGGALVDWCLHRAEAAGAREVVISSAAAMAAAHRLYTTRGFTRRPELDWSPAPGSTCSASGWSSPRRGDRRRGGNRAGRSTAAA